MRRVGSAVGNAIRLTTSWSGPCKACGRTVLAMDLALAGAETHHGRPLNRIVRRHMEAPYRYQVASDVIRDGLGVEFLDARNNVVAEVFRCDRDKTTILEIFEASVPKSAIPQMIEFARAELRAYEDGTPIEEVRVRDV